MRLRMRWGHNVNQEDTEKLLMTISNQLAIVVDKLPAIEKRQQKFEEIIAAQDAKINKALGGLGVLMLILTFFKEAILAFFSR
jgi:hypothetical protein